MLLALGLCAALIAGCGGSKSSASEAVGLERDDLVAVARGLRIAAPSIDREIAASKQAWPPIVNGLPPHPRSVLAQIDAAKAAAEAIHMPVVFSENNLDSLAGYSSSLAGLFRGSVLLATRGWQQLSAMAEQIEHGSAQAASFARKNSPLYVDSIYDAHFALSHIGEHLEFDYENLGGPEAFGSSLTQTQVDELALTYSEANARLEPHAGVKVGS